jgi:hypothetical protein
MFHGDFLSIFLAEVLIETLCLKKPCSARTLVASSKIQLGFGLSVHFGSIMGMEQ